MKITIGSPGDFIRHCKSLGANAEWDNKAKWVKVTWCDQERVVGIKKLLIWHNNLHQLAENEIEDMVKLLTSRKKAENDNGNP